MPPSKSPYDLPSDAPSSVNRGDDVESVFIGTPHGLKCANREDITHYQFADEGNEKITHLDDFGANVSVKCPLGQPISRCMVLIASEQKLIMMRPYQVYQVKNIVQCIHANCGNGTIWSTTGSSKTLTSFNASTLAALRDTLLPKLLSGESWWPFIQS